MLYFALALSFSISILLIFKNFDTYKVSNITAIIISYLTSAILSFSFAKSLDFTSIESNIYLAIILGISFFFGFVFLSLSTLKSGISVTSIASNLSVIIPVVVAAIFYNERIIGLNLVGAIMTIPAIILIFIPNKSKKFKLILIIYPIIIFLIGGFNNTILRQAQMQGAMADPMLFIAIIFFIAFFIAIFYSLTIYLYNKSTTILHGYGILLKKNIKINLSVSRHDFIFGIALGIANFASTYFFLKCLNVFSSALFFPIYNISFIGLSTFIGVVFYREKLNKINYIGLSIAVVAVFLMNWK